MFYNFKMNVVQKISISYSKILLLGLAVILAIGVLLLSKDGQISFIILGVLGACVGFIYNLKYPGFFVFLFLVTKPLVDLTWRWRFANILGQDINLQTIVAVYVIAITVVIVFLMKKLPILDLWVLLFSGIAITSSLIAENSGGINVALRLISGVSFFFIAGLVINSEDKFQKFSDLFILAVSVPLVISLLQVAGVIQYEYLDWINGQPIGRATGSYQHPLDLVYFVIYLIPILFYCVDKYAGKVRSILYVAVLTLAFVAVYFTYHRTALFVLGIQIMLWLLLKKRYRELLVLSVIGILGVILLSSKIATLYSNLLDILQGKISIFDRDFLRGRGSIWYLFLTSWLNSNPLHWIIGQGASITSGYVPDLGFFETDEPHNDFLRILVSYGLSGLFIYLIILGHFLLNGLKLLKSKIAFEVNVGIILIISTLSVIILSLTGEPTRYPSCSWYLFTLGSIAVFLVNNARTGTNLYTAVSTDPIE